LRDIDPRAVKPLSSTLDRGTKRERVSTPRSARPLHSTVVAIPAVLGVGTNDASVPRLEGVHSDYSCSSPMWPSVRVAVLNGFQLTSGGHPVPLVVSVQRLVAFLALQEHAVPRAYVAGTLWIDSSDKRAAGSLRSALWRLNACAMDVVDAAGSDLQLAPGVAVDLRESQNLAADLTGSRRDCPDPLLHGLTLFTGELLPGWYDDWVLLERERHRQTSLCTLERLCECLTAHHRFAEAVVVGLATVNAEPLRESAHRALIKAHLAHGNASEAVRQYRLCCRLLRLELQLGPSDHLKELMRPVGVD
jgi:DNA-binding SARP family transcriptional activator